MELTDRERRVVAELERQFHPGPADGVPGHPGDGTGQRRRTALRRAAAPAAVLGAVLLGAGILLAVVSSAVLGAVLLASWVVVRFGRTLAAAARWLAAGAAASAAVAGCPPVPWWPTDDPP